MADASAFLRTQAQVERSVTSIGQRMRESAAAGVVFAAGYKAFDAATNAIGKTAGAVVKYASDLQGARVAWTNLLGTQEAAEAQILRMQQTAANTPFDFPAVEKGTRRFMAMGFSLSEATEGMHAVIAAASGLNTGTAGIDSMVRALGQMRSNVRVNAEDMNQLVDAQVPAWTILAQAMGKTEAEVRKLSEEGKIMSSTFITAFQAWSQAKFGDAVVAQSKTLTGALSTIRDNILGTGSTAIQPFIELLTRLANRVAEFSGSPAFAQWAAKVAAGLQVAIDTVGSLAGIFGSALQGVLAVVSSAGQAIYEALSWINPFARHSPSLVEQVEAGVDRIIAKYAELSGGVANGLRGAQGAVQAFLAASAAGLADWEEAQRQAEAQTLAVFGEGVPAAYLAAREAVEELRAGLAPLAADIQRQEGVVDAWAGQVEAAQAAVDAKEASIKELERAMRPLEEAVKSAQAALDGERQALDAAKDAVDALKERLGAAQQRLQEFAKTPLAGTQAFADQLFAIEQQAAAVELALVEWRLSPELAAQLADLSGQITQQQGVVAGWTARVRDAEAAIEDQEAVVASWQGRVREAEEVVEDQQRVVGQWTARIKEAQRALDDQEQALDVWRGRIAAAAGAVKDQEAVVSGWATRIREADRALKDQEAALDGYRGRIKGAEAAVVAQEGVVAAWTARIREAERALRDQEAALVVWEVRIRAAQAAVDDQEGVVKSWAAGIREAEAELARQERALDVWQGRIRDAERAITDQERAVRAAERTLRDFDRQVDEAKDALDRQKLALVGAKDQVDAYAAGLKDAIREIDNLARAQLQGTQAFSDQAFAIDQQATAVKFALNDIERGIEPTRAGELLRAQLLRAEEQAVATAAALAEMYANPTGNPQDLLLAANADHVARERVESINRALAILDPAGSAEGDVAALKDILDELGLSADQVRLREKLELDPLRRDIERLAHGTDEMSFSAVIAGITTAKERQAELLAGQAAATAAWREQAAAVGAAAAALADVERARDAQQAVVAREKQDLQDLRDGLDDIKRGYEEARAALEPYRDAVERLREGEAAAKAVLDQRRDALDDLKRQYDAARQALDPYREAVDAAKLGEQDAKAALDDTRAALDGLKREYQDALDALDPYRQAIEEARRGEQDAKDILGEKRDALQGVKDGYEAAKEGLDPYRRAVEDARRGEQDAKAALDDTRAALDGVKEGYDAARAGLEGLKRALNAARDGEQAAKGDLDALNDALKATQQPSAALTAELERLRLEAQQVKLREQLELDPLRRDIERLANPVKELTFAEITAGMADARAEIAVLEPQLVAATAAWEAQQGAVKRAEGALKVAEGARDAQRAAIEREQLALVGLRDQLDATQEGHRQEQHTLAGLKDAYSAATGVIADMEKQLDGVQRAGAAATQEAERLRKEQEKLAALGKPQVAGPVFNPDDLAQYQQQLDDIKQRYNTTKQEIEGRVSVWKERIKGAFLEAREYVNTFTLAVAGIAEGIRTGNFNNLFGPLLLFIEQAFGPEARDKAVSTVSTIIDWLERLHPVAARVLGFIKDHWRDIAVTLGVAWAAFQVIGGATAIVAGIYAALNPVTAVVGAIAVGVGLLAAAWINNWGDIRGRTAEVLDFLRGITMPLQASFRELVDTARSMGPELRGVADAAGGLWRAIQPVVALALGLVFLQWQSNLALFVGFVTGALPGLIFALEGAITFLRGIAETVAAAIKLVFNVIINTIRGMFTGDWSRLKQDFLDDAEDLARGLLRILQGGLMVIAGVVGGVLFGIGKGVWEWVQTVVGFFRDLYDRLVGHSIVPDMMEAIAGWFSWLWGEGKRIFTLIKVGIGVIWDEIKDNSADVWRVITGALAGQWGEAFNAAERIFTRIREFIFETWDKLKEKLEGSTIFRTLLVEPFKRARDSIANVVQSFSFNILSALQSGLEGIWKFVRGVREAINWVSNNLGLGSIIPEVGDPPSLLAGFDTGAGAGAHVGAGAAYAAGTAFHPGGPALVSEAGREFVKVAPGAPWTLVERPTLLNLRRGAKVVPNAATEALLNRRPGSRVPAGAATDALLAAGVPGFALGLNWDDIKQAITSTIKSAGTSVLDFAREWLGKGANALADAALKAAGVEVPQLPGAMRGVGAALMGRTRHWLVERIKGMLDAARSILPTATGDTLPGIRGVGWGDATPGAIDALLQRYGGGNSPFSAADIDRLSDAYGVPEGLILGLLQKESQMGSNAGALAPYHNYGGITATPEQIAAGQSYRHVFPGGETRDFLIFGSPREYLEYKYQFLMGSYYKNKSLEELIGNYYAGPQAWAKYGTAATDMGGGGAPSPNGTVQDYINLVLDMEQRLTGLRPDQRAIVIGDRPPPVYGPEPGTSDTGFVGDAWSAPMRSYTISQEFGHNSFAETAYASGSHGGIDLVGPYGAAVLAAANGTVTGAGWQGGYGNAVTLAHGAGLESLYGHMDRLSVSLRQIVARGETLGIQGTTGYSTGDHLHFEIRRDGVPVNPREYVGFAGGGWLQEPVVGRGLRTGAIHTFNEDGLGELVLNRQQVGALARRDCDERERVVVNAPITITIERGEPGEVRRAVKQALRELEDEWTAS